MVVYKIYIEIQPDLYENVFQFLITNDYQYSYKGGVMSGFYAWSTDKEMIKKFKASRNPNIFNYEKCDLSYDEYDELKDSRNHLKLSENKFRTITKSNNKYKRSTVTIVSTKNEFLLSTYENYGIETIGDVLYKNFSIHSIPYKCFNKNISYALNITGILDHIINELGTRTDRECLDYNNGFGLTFDGNENKLIKYLSNEELFDELVAFIIIFGVTIKGE